MTIFNDVDHKGAAEFTINALGSTMIAIIVLGVLVLVLIIGWIITAVSKDAKMYRLLQEEKKRQGINK